MNVQKCVTLLDTRSDINEQLSVNNGVNEAVLQVYVKNGVLQLIGMITNTPQQNPYNVGIQMQSINLGTRYMGTTISQSGIYVVQLEGISVMSVVFTDYGEGEAHVVCKTGNLTNVAALNTVAVSGDTSGSDMPQYTGPYTITPLVFQDITLQTAYHWLASNIVVKQIPYSDVANDSGGVTVTIG